MFPPGALPAGAFYKEMKIVFNEFVVCHANTRGNVGREAELASCPAQANTQTSPPVTSERCASFAARRVPTHAHGANYRA